VVTLITRVARKAMAEVERMNGEPGHDLAVSKTQ
jgi:hypothetical protein